MPLYISSGLGITMVNETSVINVDPGIQLIPASTHPPYCKMVVYHPDNKNPLLPAFLKLFKNEKRH